MSDYDHSKLVTFVQTFVNDNKWKFKSMAFWKRLVLPKTCFCVAVKLLDMLNLNYFATIRHKILYFENITSKLLLYIVL